MTVFAGGSVAKKFPFCHRKADKDQKSDNEGE